MTDSAAWGGVRRLVVSSGTLARGVNGRLTYNPALQTVRIAVPALPTVTPAVLWTPPAPCVVLAVVADIMTAETGAASPRLSLHVTGDTEAWADADATVTGLQNMVVVTPMLVTASVTYTGSAGTWTTFVGDVLLAYVTLTPA